jgi:hypothetical protein
MGEVSSAGYSGRFGCAVALVYARGDALDDATLADAHWEIDVAGQCVAARAHVDARRVPRVATP